MFEMSSLHRKALSRVCSRLSFVQRRFASSARRSVWCLGVLAALGSAPLRAADPSEATITQPSGAVTATVNQSLSFAGTSTDSVGYDIYTVNSYGWTFGDGATSANASDSHVYTAAGTYTVTFTVHYTGKTCTNMDPNTGNCLAYRGVGRVATATRTITVVPAPVTPVITAASNVTTGTTGLTASIVAQTGMTYAWTLTPDGTITAGQGTTSITYTAGAAGTATLHCVVTNAAGATATGTQTIAVAPVPMVPVITAASNVTTGATGLTASIVAQTGMTYAWTLTPDGTITAGQSTTSITYTAGAAGTATLHCVVTNAAGTTAAGTQTVTVAPVPVSVITAASNVTTGTTGLTASVAAQTGMTYLWSVTGNGTLATGQGTTSITYTAGAAGTAILHCVVTNAAGATATGTQTVTVASVPVAPTITAASNVTTGATGLAASIAAQTGMTYLWSVTGNGTLATGQSTTSITYTAGVVGTATIQCVVTNAAGATATGTQAVTVAPVPVVPVITAASNVTTGATGLTASVAAQTGMTYAWTLTPNGTITAGQSTTSITYTAGTAGAATLQCVVTNAAGATATGSKTVTVAPVPVSAITAATNVTTGATGLTASVATQTGMTYAWTLTPSGTITAGQGTTAITYTAGAPGTATLQCTVTNVAGATSTGTKAITVLAPGQYTATGSMSVARIYATTTLLPNGKVLVAGGYNSAGSYTSQSDLYDPSTGTFTPTGNMTAIRGLHTATLLPNGKVLIAGGVNATTYLSSAELYDPATGTFTATGGMASLRAYSTATLLQNGKVLMSGGYTGGALLSACEIYDPATGTFSSTGSLNGARRQHVATMLSNGNVLVMGGLNTSVLATAEIYSFSTGTWSTTGSMTSPRRAFAAALLPSGKVLAVGGYDGTIGLSSAELYDPSTGAFSATGGLPSGEDYETVTLLPTGVVLVSGTLANGELYDPAAGTFSQSGGVVTGRMSANATLLPNGKVLISGGDNGGAYFSSAEVFDPQVSAAAGMVPNTTITTATQAAAGGTGVTASVPWATGATYEWSITDGTITGGQGTNTLTYTAGATGTLTITCLVTSPLGIPAMGSASVSVILAPVTTITAVSAATTGTTGLTASVPAQTGASFAWSITGGAITSGQTTNTLTYSAGNVGTVVLSCQVTGSDGLVATGSKSIPVVAAPVATILAPPAVATGSTGLIASVPAQAGATYLWSVTGGNITAGQSSNALTYTAGGLGTLTLQCVVTNAAGTSLTGTASQSVVAATTVTISVPAIVTASTPNLSASVPVQSGATYLWSITGGTLVPGYETRPVTYFTAGTGSSLTLQCAVTNASGTTTGSQTISVVPAPSISGFSAASNPLTKGANTILTASFTNGTGSIDNGVGAIAANGTVTVTPSTTTLYTLTVLNTAGTKTTATCPLTVVGPDTTVSAPSPVTAGAVNCIAHVPNVGGSSFLWTVANGTLTSGQGMSFIYYTPGTSGICTLTCQVTNANGASATGSTTATIIPAPVITSFTPSSTDVTRGGFITLTPVFSNGVGTINQGVGAATSGVPVKVYPGQYGIYTLTVTNAAGTSAAVSTPNIYVDYPPSVQLTTSTNATAGWSNGLHAIATVYNNNSAVGDTFQWTVSNGSVTVGGGSEVFITPVSVGNCQITCTVTNPAGVTASATATVPVVAAPVITSFTANSTTVTAGQSVTVTPVFTGGTGVITNSGVLGAPYIGPVTSGQAVTFTPSASDTLDLTVTDVAGNGAGNYTYSMLRIWVNPVNPSDIVAASPVTAGVDGFPASVPNPGDGTTWAWSISNGTITSGQNASSITFMPTTAGTPCVLTCVVTPHTGSVYTKTASIPVIVPPTIGSFTASANNVAPGTSVTLTPTYSGGIGTVDGGIGGVTSGTSFNVAPKASSTFTLTVTNAAKTAVTAGQGITVMGLPDSTITVSNPVTAGVSYQASALWQWQIGATHTWSITNGTITYNSNQGWINFTPTTVGTCTLTDVVTDAAGLSSTGVATLTVLAAPTITQFTADSLIPLGGTAKLMAWFQNGQGQIDNGVGPVTSGTAVFVSPTVSTTYTLTVISQTGTSTTAQATVGVPTSNTISVTPSLSWLPVGVNQLFLAQDSVGKLLSPLWSVLEPSGGLISSYGVYTPPLTAGIYHVQAARSDVPSLIALATVTVPVQVMLDQESVSLLPGASLTFHAAITGTTDARLVWTVQEGASGGSVDANGTYTAPASPGTYHVLVVSPADPTAYDIATIQVSGGQATVVLSPGTVQLAKGGTQTFTATVQNASNPAITWSCSGGTVTQSGSYTAPNLYGTYTVTAALTSDPTIRDTATVVVPGGSVSGAFTYDANGNMTGDGARTFTWDAENRLASVTILATGHVSQFTYDEFGRRVEIVERDNGSTTNDTKYLWSGTEIVESRTATGATVLQHYYAQGFVDSDATNLYYTRDHLGSMRELTDSTQTIRARYDYDSWGRVVKLQGDKASALLYSGYWQHAQSGLYLTLFRAYDPNTAKWVSRDPMGTLAGLNLYRYVHNNPINLTDPFGLCENCNSCMAKCSINPPYEQSGCIEDCMWGACYNDPDWGPPPEQKAKGRHKSGGLESPVPTPSLTDVLKHIWNLVW